VRRIPLAVARAFDALPHFLVEVIGDGVAERLDQGQRAADADIAGEGIADAEGDGHVDGGEAEGFGHDVDSFASDIIVANRSQQSQSIDRIAAIDALDA